MSDIIYHVEDSQGKGHVAFSPSCLAPRQGRSLRVQHHELQVCSMESLSLRSAVGQALRKRTKPEAKVSKGQGCSWFLWGRE